MARKVKSNEIEAVKVVYLGKVTVNYDETIDQKIAANRRVIWDMRFPTDQLFPDNRKGETTYAMSFVVFDRIVYTLDSVREWCKKHKRALASPKEALDLVRRDFGAASGPRVFWVSGQIGMDQRFGSFELMCEFPMPGGPVLFKPVMAIEYAINLRWYLVLGKPSKRRSKP